MKRPFYPLELEPCLPCPYCSRHPAEPCLGEVEWCDDEPTSPGFEPIFCGCPLCFEGENQ